MYKVLVICSLAVLSNVDRADGAVKGRPRYSTQSSINEDRYLQILSRVDALEKRDKQQQADIDGLRSELLTEKRRTSILEGIVSRLRLYGGFHGGDGVKVTPDDGVKVTPGDGVKIMPGDGVKVIDGEEQTHGPNEPSGKDTDVKIPRIRRQSEVPVIAFYATLVTHQEHTGLHQSIAFDNVVTNIGNAYNKLHGNFRAPVHGVYVFSTTLLSANNNAMGCSVMKNGRMVANLYMTDSATNFDADSATVVLYLNKGDDVTVESESTDKFVHGNHQSLFSGFLLHEDESASIIVGK